MFLKLSLEAYKQGDNWGTLSEGFHDFKELAVSLKVLYVLYALVCLLKHYLQ